MSFDPNKLNQYRTTTLDKPIFNLDKLQGYKTKTPTVKPTIDWGELTKTTKPLSTQKVAKATYPTISNVSEKKLIDFKKFAPSLISARQQGVMQKLGMPSINKRYGKGFLGGVVSVIEGSTRAMEAFIPAPFAGKYIGKWIGNKAKVAREFYQPPDPKFTDMVASGFGSMAGFILPGLGVARAAQGAILAPRLANWLGAIASGVFESMTEGGFSYSRAKEKEMTDKQAVGAATKTFWLNLPTVVFTNKLGIFGDKGGMVRKGIISAPIESIQEWTQQIIGNMAVQDPIFEGALESALVGGIVGGGTGVAMGVFETKPEMKPEAPKPKPTKAPFEYTVKKADAAIKAKFDKVKLEEVREQPKGEGEIEEGIIYERKSTDERRIVKKVNGKWVTQWHIPGEKGKLDIEQGTWVPLAKEDSVQLEKDIAEGVWKPQPKGEGEILNNLNPTGSVFANYTPAKRATMPLGKNITTLDKTMKKSPDETITIYRGTLKGKEIVAGDFVTTNKQLAQDYAGTGEVVEKKVKLSDILDDKTEPLGEEYIYRPKLSQPKGEVKTQKAKVLKKVVEAIPAHLEEMKERIATADPGRRQKTEAGEWIGVSSEYPEYFRNRGYKSKEVLNILQKVADGKPLTPKQEAIFNDIYTGYKEQLQKEAEDVKTPTESIIEEGFSESEAEQINNEIQEVSQSEINTEFDGIKPEGAEQTFLEGGEPKFPEGKIEPTMEQQLTEEKGELFREKPAEQQPLITRLSSFINERGNVTRGGDVMTAMYEGRTDAELEEARQWAASHKSPSVRRVILHNIEAEIRVRKKALPPKGIPGLGKLEDFGAPTKALRGIDAFEGIPENSPAVELRLFEEVKKIAKKYANIIGEKYVPRKFLGIQWGDTNNIFVKALNDLSTTIHEVVHYVDSKKGIFKKIMEVVGYAKNGNPIYAPETKPMRKQITECYMEFYPMAKKTHKLKKRVREGLAVFIENYIAQPTAMKEKYPVLHKEFLVNVGGKYYDSVLPALVKDSRNLIGSYQKLEPLKKVGTKVLSDDQPIIRDSFMNFKEKVINEMVDNVYPLEKMAVEAGVQWTKQDPSLWTRLYNNLSGIITRNINTNKGFVHFKNEELVKLYDFNWKTLIEDLKRAKFTDDFSYWLVARREYFMHQKLEGMKEKVLEAAETMKMLKEEDLLQTVEGIQEAAWARKVMDDYKHLASIIAKDGFSKSVVTNAYLKHKDQFAPYAEQFDKMVRADLDFMRDVGMIKPQDYADYIEQEGYATFKRDIYNEVVGEGREVSGIAKVSKKVSSLKRRGGSELTIINPVYSSIKNHSEIMRKGMKQLIRNKIYNLKGYFPDLMQGIPLVKVPKLGGGFEYPQDRDPNILMAMDNGRRHPVLVSKEIMTVVNELLTFKNMHIFERLVVKASRMFTKGTTGLYPPFAIQNFFVDQITASAQTTTKYKPVISQLNLLYKQLEGHSEVAKYVQEYLMLGGQRHTFVGWLDMNPNEFFTAITKEKNTIAKVGDMLDQGFQLIATPVQFSEILTRGVEYANSRLAGEDQIVALERAGRVSAPFHHIGRWGGETAGRTLVKSIPYFNASLQVLAQYSRTMKNPKTRKRATFVLFALSAAITGGYLGILLGGTDEQKELYKDLHPRELAHYLFFPSPNGKDLLRLRVPEQMSAFATLMNMALSDVFLGTQYTKKEYVDAATSWVPDQFNVTDPIRVIFSWIPHILGTTTEVLMNKRTYPKVMPIEGMAMERHEAQFRYHKNTGWLAKYLGEKLNLSPRKIDYLIEGMVGRTSKFIKGGKINNPIIREVYFKSGRRLVEFYELRKTNDQQFDSYRNKFKEFSQDEIREMYKVKSKIAEISYMLRRYNKEEQKENNLEIEKLRKDILDKIDALKYTQ